MLRFISNLNSCCFLAASNTYSIFRFPTDPDDSPKITEKALFSHCFSRFGRSGECFIFVAYLASLAAAAFGDFYAEYFGILFVYFLQWHFTCSLSRSQTENKETERESKIGK